MSPVYCFAHIVCLAEPSLLSIETCILKSRGDANAARAGGFPVFSFKLNLGHVL